VADTTDTAHKYRTSWWLMRIKRDHLVRARVHRGQQECMRSHMYVPYECAARWRSLACWHTGSIFTVSAAPVCSRNCVCARKRIFLFFLLGRASLNAVQQPHLVYPCARHTKKYSRVSRSSPLIVNTHDVSRLRTARAPRPQCTSRSAILSTRRRISLDMARLRLSTRVVIER
jgi:hypothetical protein